MGYYVNRQIPQDIM